ncbi:MAG TPA: hypothetical protein VGJ63_08805 [Micromonosporaceae bacterium]|jgi:hypothetical protein
MLDGGGGGGYAGTNWSAHDVPYMWAMVAGQQTDAHWQHVAGWRRTAELAGQHTATLQAYRDRLAEAWPPERSAASRTYVAQLDYLIGHVQATYDAANANYTAFAAATGGLSTTRYELEKIYNEYAANQQKIAQYQADLAAYEDKNVVEKLFSSKPTNPVSGQQQEALTWRARSLMYDLSGTLVEATAQIKSPPAYQPPRPIDSPESRTTAGGSGSPSGSHPPFVPPIVPVQFEQSASRSAPSAPPVARPPRPTGPTLVGASPVTTLPGPSSMAPAAPAAPGPAPLPPGGVIGALIPPTLPPKIIAPGVIIGSSAATKPGTGGASRQVGARPLPPGGVIGGRPGTAIGEPAAGTGTRTVNPTGGVIGQTSPGRGGGVEARGTTAGRSAGGVSAIGQAGKSTSGRGGSASGGPGVVGASTRGRRPESEPEQRWDPDNPWETDEGVPPVVLPPAEPGRHDPGPAIGSGA